MYLSAFIDAGALMKCTFLNPNFAIGHNQGQKGKRKSNTSVNTDDTFIIVQFRL